MKAQGGILLQVEDLRTYFYTRAGVVKAVDGVNLSIERGETLGLVGESGCGKTATGFSILRLIPPPGRIVAGRILLEGQDLLALPEAGMRKVRGGKVSIIFQDPLASLDPVLTAGDQIAEAIRCHQSMSRRAAWARAVELLRMVGIPDPNRRAKEYPHQLSGGMRQRVMIAMALSGEPLLLIADEPTSALDATIQGQILELLAGLNEQLSMSMLLITHDLGIVAGTASRVAVMYAGRIIEEAPVAELFRNPLHPYTQGLLGSMSNPGDGKKPRMKAISGAVPDLLNLPAGCKFLPRCPRAFDPCPGEEPPLQKIGEDHWVRCYLY